MKEVELPASKSLLHAVASTLAQHCTNPGPQPPHGPSAPPAAGTDSEGGRAGAEGVVSSGCPECDVVSRLIVWGRVGRKGFRAALPPLQGRHALASGTTGRGEIAAGEEALVPATPATPATPPSAPGEPATPATPPSAPAAPATPATPPSAPTAPATATTATPPSAPAAPAAGVIGEGDKEARKREGEVEGGYMQPPPAKRRAVDRGVVGGDRGEAGAGSGPVIEAQTEMQEGLSAGAERAAAYSTETRVEHKGPASMDWDDMKPEGMGEVDHLPAEISMRAFGMT